MVSTPSLLLRVRLMWAWVINKLLRRDPIARYNQDHPSRSLPLTHPQRQKAYRRAERALAKRRRDDDEGGTAA